MAQDDLTDLARRVESAERQRLVERYENGYNEVVRVRDGIDAAGWEKREGPNEWRPR